MASAIRRIQPPRIYASINGRRSSSGEIKQSAVVDHDHQRCLIEENELRELNRRQTVRLQLLEREYRQLDDDMVQLQVERDLLLKQKQMLEDELDRSSHHASANVDLHVYTQRIESECRDLRCQVVMREKEKIELNEIIADLEVQINQVRNRHEEMRDTCNEFEILLVTEIENRQCLETQLQQVNRRQKENENQIRRLQNDLDDAILTKQDVIKTNYALVQNAESLREQLRTARNHAVEARIVCASTSTPYDNLDESLSCLFDDVENNENLTDSTTKTSDECDSCQSSLFAEINSLDTISSETLSKYLGGTTDDIELDLLLSKTSTLSSSFSLLNQLINQVKQFGSFLSEQQENDAIVQQRLRVSDMKTLLKRVLDNTQTFDARFHKLQALFIAAREQQQYHQAELDDFFRLVDTRLLTSVDESVSTLPNQQRRLVTILQAYERELDGLRQITRSNDDTIRSYERQLVEQQHTTSRWRMKNTFLEKNQRKLIEKIKELNVERRQGIELSTQKRIRRRKPSKIQSEQPYQSRFRVSPMRARLSRSRSLPHVKSFSDGRSSRTDSGIVLTDEISNPPMSINANTIHRRRVTSTSSSNHFVMHTSSHVCFQKSNPTTICHSKQSTCRLRWYFFFVVLSFICCLLLLLFTFERNLSTIFQFSFEM